MSLAPVRGISYNGPAACVAGGRYVDAVDGAVDGGRGEAMVAYKPAGEVDDSGMRLVLRAAVTDQQERAPDGLIRGRPKHGGDPSPFGRHLEFTRQQALFIS